MPSAECCRMPFGLGAFAGPPLVAGHVADRIGFGRGLRLAFLVQAAAVALPAIAAGSSALAISSLVVGAMVPGIVPLVLGRVHELVPQDALARQRAWSLATVASPLARRSLPTASPFCSHESATAMARCCRR